MPLQPQLLKSLGILPHQFGLVVAAYTFSAGVAGLLTAPLIDRVSRKTAFLTLYAGFLVGTLGCGLADSYEELLFARVFTGAFGGILGGLALAIVGDVFPPHRQGAATGVLMSAFSVASILGLPAGLYLGATFFWQLPFLVLAGLGVPVMAAGLWALPSLRGHVREGPAGHPLKELWETFSHPNHLRAFGLIVAIFIGSFIATPFFPDYYEANVGVTETGLMWVYVLGGGVTLYTSPWVGRLADKYGKLRLFQIMAPFSAALIFLVTVLPPVPVAVAVAVAALMIIANSCRMVAAMALVLAGIVPGRRGSFMSANSSVQHVAAGLGSYLGGLCLTRDAAGHLVGYGWVGLIGGLVTLVSIVFARMVRPITAGPAHPEEAVAAAEVAGV
jgi:predicted MFS family arabinose efflux permease